ncbi:MAG: hypothetical protein AB7I33_08320 [Gemmatimonadales bacterium]
MASRLATIPVASPLHWYRLGDGVFGLRTSDPAFRRRFDRLYADCRTGRPDDHAPRVVCTTRSDPGTVHVVYDDPCPLDSAAFVQAIFPGPGYEELPAAAVPAGWQVLRTTGPVPDMAFSGPVALFPADAPWQRFAGNLGVNRVLRLQTGTVFFHGAAAVVGGRAVVLLGPKGAGKTTLSLALASRGHEFLGDETAGVRLKSREVIPVRRTTAIREGPAAERVRKSLAGTRHPRERFPDGSVRVRARGSRLFGESRTGAAPLGALIFLEGFGEAPGIERLAAGREHLARLTPLACSMWEVPAGRRAMELASLLTATTCYTLKAGPPDATAELIERTLED